jgi:mono/diheme cytochrome c family protein
VSRTRIAVILAAILAVLGIYVIIGGSDDKEGSGATVSQETNTSGAPGADAEQPLTPTEERGRNLFVSNCGACHTLDAAGTEGSVGPNLDEVPNNEEDVLTAIEQGGKQPGGAMPVNIVAGDDAKAVAKFVAVSGPGV